MTLVVVGRKVWFCAEVGLVGKALLLAKEMSIWQVQLKTSVAHVKIEWRENSETERDGQVDLQAIRHCPSVISKSRIASTKVNFTTLIPGRSAWLLVGAISPVSTIEACYR